MEPIIEDINLTVAATTEKKSGSYNIWTKRQENLLVSVVFACKGHIKTDETMQKKWEKIVEVLMAKDDFKNNALPSWKTVQAKFKRMMDAVEDKTALRKEGEIMNYEATHKGD